MRNKLPRIAVVFLVAVILLPQTFVAAVNLEADVGLGGYYKPGMWMPVDVTIENPGKTGFEGEIVVVLDEKGGKSVYAEQVNLPADSSTSFTLNVLPEEYHTRISPVLLDRNGARVAEARVKVTPLDPSDTLIVVLGNKSSAAMPEISQTVSPDTYVAYLGEAELPAAWPGYDAADWIIFDDGVEALGQKQKDALSRWLASGGSALVSTRECTSRDNGLIAGILPVELNTTVEVDSLPVLEELYGPIEGSAHICTSTIDRGKAVLATANGTPIIVKGSYGRGTIVFMAFDYTSQPFKEWSGMSGLFKDEFTMFGEAKTEGGISSETDSTMWGVLRELPSLDIPEFKYLFLFLLLYIAAVGPLNYFILIKRRKRPDYAWFTIPLIIAVFTVGAYGIGYGIKGGDLIVTETGVIEGSSSSPYLATSTYFGIFSPRKTAYDIDIAARGKVYNLLPSYRPDWGQTRGSMNLLITGDTGGGSTIKDLDMYMWSFKSFAVKTVEATEGFLDADLRVEGGNITGTVKNRFSYPITNAYIAYRGNALSLGTINPGREAGFTLPLEESKVFDLSYPIPDYANSRADGISDLGRYKRDGLLSRMTNIVLEERGKAPLLIGLVNWTTGIDVADETPVKDSQYIFLYHLPFFMPSTGNVSINWGTAEKRVAEAHYTETLQVNSDGGVEIDEGSYKEIMELPVVLTGKEKVEVKKAWLRIPSSAPFTSSQINFSIFNWRKQEWEDIAAFSYQDQSPSASVEMMVPPRPLGEKTITLDAPDDYIMFPMGVLKIKVEVVRGKEEETAAPKPPRPSSRIYVPPPDIKAELSITGDSSD